MATPSQYDISSQLLEAITQINLTAVSHKRTGMELEDSTMASFIDQLNLSNDEIYDDGLVGIRERATNSGKAGKVNDVNKQKKAQLHLSAIANLKQILAGEVTPHPVEATFFVKHPLGKQNWPEFILYHNGKVLPIEVKSSGNGRITWNGGMPRQGCLYVYYYTKKKSEGRRATLFFGEDMITDDIYKKLRENHEKVQEFTKKIHAETFQKDGEDMYFSEYARAMYTHKLGIHKNQKSNLWLADVRLKMAEWGGADKKKLAKLLEAKTFEENKINTSNQVNENSKDEAVTNKSRTRSP